MNKAFWHFLETRGDTNKYNGGDMVNLPFFFAELYIAICYMQP